MANYFLTNKAVEIFRKYMNIRLSLGQREELIDFCQLLAENPMIGRNYSEVNSGFMFF